MCVCVYVLYTYVCLWTTLVSQYGTICNSKWHGYHWNYKEWCEYTPYSTCTNNFFSPVFTNTHTKQTAPLYCTVQMENLCMVLLPWRTTISWLRVVNSFIVLLTYFVACVFSFNSICVWVCLQDCIISFLFLSSSRLPSTIVYIIQFSLLLHTYTRTHAYTLHIYIYELYGIVRRVQNATYRPIIMETTVWN